MSILTSTISDGTVVRWPKIVNEIIATVCYVDIKSLPATVTKDVDACIANHIFSFDFWMSSVQPNRSSCTAVIFRHLPFWDSSASIAREAIPSPAQIPITKRLFSSFPNSLRTTPRLVYRFVSTVATTVTTTSCPANKKTWKHQDE